MAGTPWRVPRVSRGRHAGTAWRLRAAFASRDAHVDLAPAPVVDEPLQHFAEHVEIHPVVPIDQFDRFTVLTAQFHHVGAFPLRSRIVTGLELCGRDRGWIAGGVRRPWEWRGIDPGEVVGTGIHQHVSDAPKATGVGILPTAR